MTDLPIVIRFDVRSRRHGQHREGFADSGVSRQIPAMQKIGSSSFVKSHLSFRFFFGSFGSVNS
jgi:hypothetical protein